jgi:hypothetical protein
MKTRYIMNTIKHSFIGVDDNDGVQDSRPGFKILPATNGFLLGNSLFVAIVCRFEARIIIV